MSLDATVGGASANSYVTQAAATSFYTDRLDAATLATWTTALSSSDKDSYLIAATLRLDTESFIGAPVYVTQRLRWPRYGAYNSDGILLDGATIPQNVQQATFELAFALVKEPTLLGDTGLEGFVNVKVGSLDVTPRAVGSAAALPSIVKRLLASVRVAGFGSTVSRA